MKKTTLIFLFVATAGFLSACSSGVSDSLQLSRITVEESDEAAPKLEKLNLTVSSVLDARSDESIGAIDGREIQSEGNVGSEVVRSLEQELKARGAQLKQFNAPKIKGEVRDWQVHVEPGFPASAALANAEIRLHILDINGEVRYTGTYLGEAQSNSPFLSNEGVESTLGKAMGFALKEALEDEGFVGTLSKLQTYPTAG